MVNITVADTNVTTSRRRSLLGWTTGVEVLYTREASSPQRAAPDLCAPNRSLSQVTFAMNKQCGSQDSDTAFDSIATKLKQAVKNGTLVGSLKHVAKRRV